MTQSFDILLFIIRAGLLYSPTRVFYCASNSDVHAMTPVPCLFPNAETTPVEESVDKPTKALSNAETCGIFNLFLMIY